MQQITAEAIQKYHVATPNQQLLREVVMDLETLPPEINSARMYAGAVWDGLAYELSPAAASYQAVASGLTGETWLARICQSRCDPCRVSITASSDSDSSEPTSSQLVEWGRASR